MSKKEKQTKELGEERSEIEVGRISFAFNITRDEADKVINDPKHPVAKKLHKFMKAILKSAAKKMLETKPNESINNCKLDV